MKKTNPPSPRLSAPAALLLAALALTIAPGAAHPHPKTEGRADAPKVNAGPVLTAGGVVDSNQVRVTVTDSGFTPASATASAGLIHLTVTNQSADSALTLRVERQGGELVRELTAPEGAREWLLELDLGAGSYAIKAAGHASWTFALTVQ